MGMPKPRPRHYDTRDFNRINGDRNASQLQEPFHFSHNVVFLAIIAHYRLRPFRHVCADILEPSQFCWIPEVFVAETWW